MNQTFIQQDPSIERRRKLAQAMMDNTPTGPVRTGTEGMARIVQQLMGGYQAGKANRDQAQYGEEGRADLARIMSDMGNDIRPLSQHPSTQNAAMMGQMQQQAGDQRAEAAQLSRAQGREDFEFEQRTKQKYAKPQQGTTAERNALSIGLMPGTDEFNQYVRQVTMKAGTSVTVNNNPAANLTKGEQKLDEAYGSDLPAYLTGGYADTEKQLDQLNSALGDLESGENLTGPGIGSVPDFVKKFTNPKSIATREAVEEVVQRNLREILGAQFTENEGERLIKRAYNENLEEGENVIRVKRLIKQMTIAAQAKKEGAKYFRLHGTLKGWSGRLPTKSDFDNIDYESAKSASPGANDIEAEIKRRGLK